MKKYFLAALALFFLSNPGFSQVADLSELNIISLEDKTHVSKHTIKSMNIFSSEIYTLEIVPPERPIGSITVSLKVEEDPDFRKNHNIVLEDDKE